MAGKRTAGEGTFWKRGDRWYGKRRIGPREAVVTINASGATRAEAATALREKVNQYERGLTVEVDNSATLAQYLDWWLRDELAEQVAHGSLMATTREQYVNKVQHQIGESRLFRTGVEQIISGCLLLIQPLVVDFAWRPVPQPRVQPSSIVAQLHVTRNVTSGMLTSRVLRSVHQLVLQDRKERFRHRVEAPIDVKRVQAARPLPEGCWALPLGVGAIGRSLGRDSA